MRIPCTGGISGVISTRQCPRRWVRKGAVTLYGMQLDPVCPAFANSLEFTPDAFGRSGLGQVTSQKFSPPYSRQVNEAIYGHALPQGANHECVPEPGRMNLTPNPGVRRPWEDPLGYTLNDVAECTVRKRPSAPRREEPRAAELILCRYPWREALHGPAAEGYRPATVPALNVHLANPEVHVGRPQAQDFRRHESMRK